MRSRRAQVAVSAVLTVALLAFFFWNVDLGAMLAALADADPWLLAAAGLLALFAYWLRIVRWIVILRPVGVVRHSAAVMATAVGYAAITLLPARIGDLLRPVLLARSERLPTSAALASILTERIFDLWTVVAFFVLFLVAPPARSLSAEGVGHLHTLETSGWVAAVGLVVGTAFLVGLLRFQDRFVTLVTAPVAWLKSSWRQPFAALLHHFLDGLRIVARPRELALTLGLSIAMWLVIYCQLAVTLVAFDVRLPLSASYLLVTLTVLGLAIPTPGGVGGFHAALQIGLTQIFGVGVSVAAGIAVAYHALCFVPITLIGLACIPALGLSFRQAEELAVEPLEATAEEAE